jgi:hypothetical protein
LDTLHIPRIPFRCNSVEGNSCIPAEFEFHSKFRRNFFINFAGPSAKIDSSGIPGIARIPPDSGRNQWGTVKTSLYGKTDAYYGTVEQQGRLTLHLHLLLWIKGALSPQEIRDRIMDPSSDFQKCMVEYLESVHKGELYGGIFEDIRAQCQDAQKNNPEYKDPTHTLQSPIFGYL